jgi:hypothetical protein
MGEGGPPKSGPGLRRAEVASATQAGEGLCRTGFGGTIKMRANRTALRFALEEEPRNCYSGSARFDSTDTILKRAHECSKSILALPSHPL